MTTLEDAPLPLPLPLSAANDFVESINIIRPANTQAEQLLLGALLINNTVFDRFADFLRADHFSVDAHADIYRAVGDLIGKGLLANPVTLKPYFDNHPGLKKVGGAFYLARLVANVIIIVNAEDFARTVHDHALRRSAIDVLIGVLERLMSHSTDADARQIITEGEQLLGTLLDEDDGAPVQYRVAVAEALGDMDRAYKANGALLGVTTGLVDLDAVLGGLQSGEYIVAAGRTSMGKTVLLQTVARAAAEHYLAEADAEGGPPKEVLFFSLEMRRRDVAKRDLARNSGVTVERQRGVGGVPTAQEVQDVGYASSNLVRLPIYIDDTSGPAATVMRMRSIARRMKRRGTLRTRCRRLPSTDQPGFRPRAQLPRTRDFAYLGRPQSDGKGAGRSSPRRGAALSRA